MKKTYLIKYTRYDGSEWKHEDLEEEITIEESELKNWLNNFAGVQDNYDEIVINVIAEKTKHGWDWLRLDKYIDKSN